MMNPRVNRTDEVSTDKQACRWGRLKRTVENRANEISGKIGLLVKVQTV